MSRRVCSVPRVEAQQPIHCADPQVTPNTAAEICGQLMDLRAVGSSAATHMNQDRGSIKTYRCVEGVREASQCKAEEVGWDHALLHQIL